MQFPIGLKTFQHIYLMKAKPNLSENRLFGYSHSWKTTIQKYHIECAERD